MPSLLRRRCRRARAAPLPASRPSARAGALVLGLVAASAATAAAPHAARADEDDWQLSGRAGAGSVTVDGRDPLGPRAGADVQYGLTDAWAIRASSALSRHDVSTTMNPVRPGGAIWSYSLFAGVGWCMDVLRLLPSFELGVGVLGVTGAVTHPRAALGMQVGVGADYLMGPRWSLGAVAEYVFAPFDLLSNALTGNEVPQAFALSLRVSWILR